MKQRLGVPARRGSRMDRAGGARIPPSRQGAAAPSLQERIPQYALQLHHGFRWSGAIRLNTGIAQRRSDRERSAATGSGLGVSLGAGETGPGLYRIEVTCGPGSGVRILNQPTPPAFRESVRVGEQNLYARAKALVETATRERRSSRLRCVRQDGRRPRCPGACRVVWRAART